MTNIVLGSEKRKYYLIATILIILIFIPVQIPFKITSQGRILPQKQYLLVKGADGKIISSLKNNITGSMENFSVTQFERGDVIQFFMNDNIAVGSKVNKNDTLAYISSNLSESELIKLKSELANEIALLKLSSSREKESIINAERQRLEYARKQLEEQTNIFNRQKSLFEKQLISEEEYELAKSSIELFKINVDIASQRLQTVETGSKPEEIELIKTKVVGLQNQIRILGKKFLKYYLLSPINGIVQRSFSQDTLLIVEDVDAALLFVPIKTNDTRMIKEKLQVNIYSSSSGKNLSSKILKVEKAISNSYYSQVNFVLVLLDNSNNKYAADSNYYDVEIIIDTLYPYEYLLKTFKQVFNLQ